MIIMSSLKVSNLLTALTVVVQAVQTYTATSLSRNYFSETKDILYCDAENSPRRRAVQFVLSQVFVLLFFLSLI